MNNIYGFCQGETVVLEEVSDPVFKEKMLGQGIAILPNKKSPFVTAPFDCQITMLAVTNHAVGLTIADGTEFLIHIGVDTVEMKGEGFTPLVKVGDNVKKGDNLMKVDWDLIDQHDYDKTVMFVNCDYTIPEFEICASDDVNSDTVVLKY
ncbi:MAG: PTS glucose transporter subunit IIA [Clostridia bacterium]